MALKQFFCAQPEGLAEGSRWSFRLFPGTTTGQRGEGPAHPGRDARKTTRSVSHVNEFLGLST
jgi:hypothetical protein